MRTIVPQRKPLARFPETTRLYPVIMKQRGKVKTRPQYVSDGLLDGVLKRVSPYLRHNPPVDILDLWPGGGFLSSKVNTLLEPRRHVLVEPNIHFRGLLTPLVESKPCYKLIDDHIYGKSDWADFFATHLPEQGPGNRESSGIIPKNDTLLVLANPPDSASAADHFKPSRWFLHFMNTCLRQTDLNLYGTVRVLATMPSADISLMLPRSVTQRSRTGVFAETIGLHNIELASPAQFEPSHQWQGWDVINDNRKLVSTRAAANEIITPPNRNLPPVKLVPEIAHRGRNSQPYERRVQTPFHEKLFEAIAAADKLGINSTLDTTDPKAKELIRNRGLALTKLVRDNSASHFRQKVANIILELDEVGRTFARAAADPKESVEGLKALEDRMVSLKSSYTTLCASLHFVMLEKHDNAIDDLRLARLCNHVDDGNLLHYRRPFEPLCISPDEIYPRGSADERSVIYFEPNPNPPVLKKVFDLPTPMVQPVLDRYFSLLALVGFRGKMPVAEFLAATFPLEPINNHVRDIPSLAHFAERRLKPGCGPMPLPDGSTSDPAFTYQENVDYDLSGVRFRTLSAQTIVEIAIKYEKRSEKLSIIALSRVLGGALTQAQLGDDLIKTKIK
ncbi:hypothetical protein N7536_011958 [Penicillium majusculum]|uniref:rRNA adenine N(6)-methyltransferase n=1 Tax=Penicillium solitum TaxID=60172 RepID=A0A1V6R6N8_9EURO|nr:uncharacterized protein PENSOL_c014G07468 [Penicillium solitum]KAJ5680819.1 hypothetical protein N7536_011958 [Penicillium majusculum]OQD96947.1 hypothetical protein PENSOL_c014G07468 [Penicillium solitum]